mgnify:CR=1 FL=1
MGNMDEVPVPFDLFYGHTVALKGSDCVKIDTTGHEKAYFTVVLCVTATGKKLPPMLIFKKNAFRKVISLLAS